MPSCIWRSSRKMPKCLLHGGDHARRGCRRRPRWPPRARGRSTRSLHGGQGLAGGGVGRRLRVAAADEELDDRLAGAAAEDDRLEQRVAAQAVGAVHAHAGALAGGVEPGQLGAPSHVGVDAAHGVVLAGHDRHRLGDRVDALEVDGEVADAGQPLGDLLPRPGGAGRGRRSPCRRCRAPRGSRSGWSAR